MEKHISLKNLANQVGMNVSSIKRSVMRHGFEPFQLINKPNQPFYLSRKDADLFMGIIRDKKEYGIISKADCGPPCVGGVYLLAVPSYSGCNRFKIGWSDNIHDRLTTYRTIIPDLRVLAIWVTNNKWCEKLALKYAFINGKQVYHELFEFEDVSDVFIGMNDIFNKLNIFLAPESTVIRYFPASHKTIVRGVG